MPLKPDDYRHHFADFDMTQAQQTAMIEALIAIAEAFADRAWGVHPSQHPQVANDNDSPSNSNVITLNTQPKTSKKEGQGSASRAQTAAKNRA